MYVLKFHQLTPIFCTDTVMQVVEFDSTCTVTESTSPGISYLRNIGSEALAVKDLVSLALKAGISLTISSVMVMTHCK